MDRLAIAYDLDLWDRMRLVNIKSIIRNFDAPSNHSWVSNLLDLLDYIVLDISGADLVESCLIEGFRTL